MFLPPTRNKIFIWPSRDSHFKNAQYDPLEGLLNVRRPLVVLMALDTQGQKSGHLFDLGVTSNIPMVRWSS